MGTPCTILAKTSDGKVKSITVNYDGYPGSAGKTLKTHYLEQSKIDALMNLGDLSSLDNSPECPEGHSYENRVKGYCVAYGRDRGEEDVEFQEHKSLEDAKHYAMELDNAFTYVWNGTEWKVGR